LLARLESGESLSAAISSGNWRQRNCLPGRGDHQRQVLMRPRRPDRHFTFSLARRRFGASAARVRWSGCAGSLASSAICGLLENSALRSFGRPIISIRMRGDACDRFGVGRLAKHCDLLVSHSQWAASEIRRRWKPRGPVVVMPHGNYDGVYPAARGRSAALTELGLNPDRPTVCFVGHLRAYKGIDTAIKAAEMEAGRAAIYFCRLGESERRCVAAANRGGRAAGRCD